MKQSADDNFEFNENTRKFSKWAENTVGKGEIFPQCFQKACFPGASKGVIVWEWLKPFLGQALSKSSTVLFRYSPWHTPSACNINITSSARNVR